MIRVRLYINKFQNLYDLDESSFFEKLMTYSGLASGYIWSKKAKKKDNLIFFKHF
jgi:hypothetical protein